VALLPTDEPMTSDCNIDGRALVTAKNTTATPITAMISLILSPLKF
jgi:hypothetical protein